MEQYAIGHYKMLGGFVGVRLCYENGHGVRLEAEVLSAVISEAS